MRRVIKGQHEGMVHLEYHKKGGDSNFYTDEFHPYKKNETKLNSLVIGAVFLPQPEPLWKQTAVSVDLIMGGLLTNVAWPGPNVEANPAGIPSVGAVGVHGIWEAPLPGQHVVVGFINGNSQDPVVLQKYHYNAHHRVDLEAAHFLPMTTKLIGPTDVVMGHHTGSFINLRGTLPLPGVIDIFSLTFVNIIGTTGIQYTTGGAYTIAVGAAYTLTTVGAVTVTVGAAYTLAVTGAITATGSAVSITAAAALTLTGATIGITSAGPVNITAVPSVIINAGARAVAAMGDVTPTMLGPSPIIATGITMLVV